MGWRRENRDDPVETFVQRHSWLAGLWFLLVAAVAGTLAVSTFVHLHAGPKFSQDLFGAIAATVFAIVGLGLFALTVYDHTGPRKGPSLWEDDGEDEADE